MNWDSLNCGTHIPRREHGNWDPFDLLVGRFEGALKAGRSGEPNPRSRETFRPSSAQPLSVGYADHRPPGIELGLRVGSGYSLQHWNSSKRGLG